MNVKQTLWISALCVLLALPAVAQEQALNLTLLKTFIRTRNDSFNLSNSGTQAFLPTAVYCPTTAPKGCTLKIEVSGTFEEIVGGDQVSITVTVSGSGLPGVDPDATIETCPDSIADTQDTGCAATDTRTFQWMQRSVPAGTKAIVKVQFAASGGVALDRSETTELFKN
jgi:hypothetical protein